MKIHPPVQPTFVLVEESHVMLLRLFTLASLLAALSSAGANAAEHALAIDPEHARVEVAVKATVDSFTAHLRTFEAVLTAANDGRITGARLAFRFNDLFTGKEKRDEAMHRWQQTKEFPGGTFILDTLEPGAAAGDFNVAGRLTFHGTTRELRFPTRIVRDGERYRIDGEVKIDTREFGLPIIRTLAVLTVNPLVIVRFHLEATRSP
jgi:polyisoprenoid-binding protein YceI